MTCPRYRHNTPDCDCEPTPVRKTVTPAQAVQVLRAWAIHDDTDAGVAACVLINHCAELERAIELVRNSHENFVRHLPDNAVHGVAVPKRKR